MSIACFYLQAADQPVILLDGPLTLKCICRVSFYPFSLANCTSIRLFAFLMLPLHAHDIILYIFDSFQMFTSYA